MKRIINCLTISVILLFSVSGVTLAWNNGYVTNNYVHVSYFDAGFLPDIAEFSVTSSYTFNVNKMKNQQTQIVFKSFFQDPSIPISQIISDITIDTHILTISGENENRPGGGTNFSGISAVAAVDRCTTVLNASGHWIGADFSITGQLGYFFYPGESQMEVTFQ